MWLSFGLSAAIHLSLLYYLLFFTPQTRGAVEIQTAAISINLETTDILDAAEQSPAQRAAAAQAVAGETAPPEKTEALPEAEPVEDEPEPLPQTTEQLPPEETIEDRAEELEREQEKQRLAEETLRKKQEAEQKRLEAERQEREAEERRLAEEQALAQKQAEAKRLAEERERERREAEAEAKEREERMAEERAAEKREAEAREKQKREAARQRRIERQKKAEEARERKARTKAQAGVRSKQGASSSSGRVSASTGSVRDYGARVRAKIARSLPPSPGRRESVMLRIDLSASGRLASVRVAKSSGNRSLDQASLAAVRRASPFPRPPRGATSRQLVFHLLFNFN